MSPITIEPLTHPSSSAVNFGARVHGADLANLSSEDFKIIESALYSHHLLLFPKSSAVTPFQQYDLTRRFDPASSGSYGHGKTLDAKRSVLHPDLKTIPHQPQVQVIGNGKVAEYEWLKDITLRHPHHRTFHATKIPDEDDLDFTRFYRWHIDAALYELNPPKVTTLQAVKVPAGRRQTVRYDDGTGEEMDVPLGTTAFVSGYQMYDHLSEADKVWARNTSVQYAAHPYIWMSGARSNSTGLGLLSEGHEVPEADLPPVDPSKIKVLPLCWRNVQSPEKLAIQVHPSAVQALHTRDPETGAVTSITDLAEVRRRVYELQRPAISPQFVYAHDWEEGDLVLFHNWGMLHTVVGAFAEDEVRIFRQCNIAASEQPKGPLDQEQTMLVREKLVLPVAVEAAA